MSGLALRRLVLLAAAIVAARPLPAGDAVSLGVLAAVRNEEGRLPILLAALERIDYPQDLLTILLADDASSDGTPELLRDFAAGKPNVRLLRLESQAGKAVALNQLLGLAPGVPLFAVYDAKHAPERGSLRLLASVFADPGIGAVSGYLEPANADLSMVSRYCALESWVTQLLHHAGKDRLSRSAPTIGGNCIYRRQALDDAGGFPAGAYSEDTEVSLALLARGWKTRFVEEARAANTLPHDFSTWWRQRTRWTLGLYQTSRRASSNPESWATAFGYFDRIVLLFAAGLALTGALAPGWLLLWVVPMLVTIPTALYKAGYLMRSPAFLLAAAVMLPFDVGVTILATVRGVLGQRVEWR